MSWKGWMLFSITLAIVGVPLWIFYYVCYSAHVDVVNGITSKEIVAVQPCMSLYQVVGILGRPYSIGCSYRPMHKFNCLNPGSQDTVIATKTDIVAFIQIDKDAEDFRMQEYVRDCGFYLEYTRRKYLANVILRAEFDQSLHLHSLSAYMHDGIGTQPIYNRSVIDSENFCDEKALKKYFH